MNTETQFMQFSRVVKFIGRNGYFKSVGLSLEIDEASNTLDIQPITSKGYTGRCSIEIPVGQIPELIEKLKEFL